MHFSKHRLVLGLLLLHLNVFRVQAGAVYTVTCVAPVGSNVVVDNPVTSTVNLYAGVPYISLTVTSTQALFGTNTNQVTAKLVDFVSTVCDVTTVSLLGAPFDGVAKPTQISQTFTRWGLSLFSSGGNYTLCYNILSQPSPYQLVPLDIIVRGVIGTANNIYCMFDPSIECSAYLPGNQLSGTGAWKLSLVAYISSCGYSSLVSPFVNTVSVPTTFTSAYEIHSFGVLAASPVLASYTACYCPGYQAVANGALMCTELTTNFVQPVGSLILVSVSATDPETGLSSAIYSRLKFNVAVNCGTGGCSTSSSPRIKFVNSSPANKVIYYDPTAGCRAALQSERYIAPVNCDPALTASCALLRSDSSTTAPTWSNVQLTNELVNNVMVDQSLDLCYCDQDCSQAANWFMVGSLALLRVQVSFTIASSLTFPTVGVAGTIQISGLSPGSFRVSGIYAREMKLLPDNMLVVGSAECASLMIPNGYVSGLECFSLSDCSVPTASSNSALAYGTDSIAINTAGWAAVCYCNAQCTVSTNWALYGRLMVRGPNAGQAFGATTGLSFDLAVTGWGLSGTGGIWFVQASTCGSASPSVAGPAGSVLTNVATIVSILPDPLSGSVISFAAPPGLSEGDWIGISGVTSGNSIVDQMVNTYHQVSILGSTSVGIVLNFASGLAPTWTVTSATWWRSSQAVFAGITVPQAGIFLVCWSPIYGSTNPSDYSATVGTLTVSDPPSSVGTIGLVTLVPGAVAPVVLSFETLSFAPIFAMTVKIVFPDFALLQPLDVTGQPLVPLSVPGLDACGLYFLEFSFPLPTGCYFADSNTLFVEMNSGNGLAPRAVYAIALMAVAGFGLSPVSLAGAEIWILDMSPVPPAVQQKASLFAQKSVQPLAGSLGVTLSVVSLYDTVAPIELTSVCSLASPTPCTPCVQESDCGNANNAEVVWCISPVPLSCPPADFDTTLEFTFTVVSNTPALGAQVRFVLSPLLGWSLGANPVVSTATTVNQAAIADNLGTGQANVVRMNLATSSIAMDAQLAAPIVLSSVAFPPNGFFESKIFFEISNPDGSSPVFGLADKRIWKNPKIVSAGLVGGPVSFAGDKNVEIVMQIQLGFDLSVGGHIQINLPPGYVCREIPVVSCDFINDPIGCGHDGSVSPNLSVFHASDGSLLAPSGRSEFGLRSLPLETNVAAWSTSAGTCVLTLQTTTKLFGLNEIFIDLLVNNPSVALQRSDPTNVWSLVVRSSSGLESAPFVLTDNGAYLGNLAVAVPLAAVEITPINFAIGPNWLTIFITTTSECVNGGILIGAPLGFDFGPVCQISDLPETYYASGASVNTRLGVGVSCVGTFNQVQISVPTGLAANTVYGFSLLVTNPGILPSVDLWSVQTNANVSSVCDASFNLSTWQSSAAGLSNVVIAIDGSNIVVSNISVVNDNVAVAVRITAPIGYVWTQFVSTSLPLASWPALLPNTPNVLDIRYLDTTLVAGTAYTLTAEISVPSAMAAGHSYDFYVEIFDAGNQSLFAGLVSTPPIPSIRNGLIDYTTSVASVANTVCMRWQTVSFIPRGGALVVQIPAGFVVAARCVPKAWTQTLLPWDVTCYADDSSVTILAGPAGIGPAVYAFCLDMVNPAASSAAYWTATSMAIVSDPTSVLDGAMTVLGFALKTLLTVGSVNVSSDSRPNAVDNQVSFYFQTEDIVSSHVTVRAPEGFVFPRDCIVANLTVIACAGAGREAVITLPAALPLGTECWFSVTNIANPSATPSWNFWSLELDAMSAAPSVGFAIWTFEFASAVKPTDYSAGASNEVSISFVPKNTVNNGFLVLTAPAGFVIATNCHATIVGVTVSCLGTPNAGNEAALTTGTLLAGTEYLLVLTVTNPAIAQSSQNWLLASFASQSVGLDSSVLLGFPVSARIPEFAVLSQSSLSGGAPVRIVVQFGLAAPLPGDLVTFTAPLGYLLNGPGQKSCTGYTGSLVPTCAGNALMLIVGQTSSTIFSVSTVNPVSSPLVNFFTLTVSRNGAIIASSTAAGSAIVPTLAAVSVQFLGAVGAGSASQIAVSFVAPDSATSVAVAGQSFVIPNNVQLVNIVPGTPTEVVFNVTNPATNGASLWTISTFNGNLLVNQIDNVVGPVVLGKLVVLTPAIVPNTYGAAGAAVALYLTSSVDLTESMTLVVSPPEGYVFWSFQPIVGIFLSSSAIDASGNYDIVLGATIRAGDLFGIAIKADTPPSSQNYQNWTITVVSVNETIATNDGLFTGFDLISLVPFTLQPENVSPSQAIFLLLTYTLPQAVVGVNNVNMQITAPIGFVFESASSCLSSNSSPFATCIGTSNVALLTSVAKSLPAGSTTIELLVTNPVTTPNAAANVWTVTLFVDSDSSQLTNSDSIPGYAIQSMTAAYVGGDRLGAVVAGFFTFTLSEWPTDYFEVMITANIGGFVFSCQPVYRVSLDYDPICYADGPVTFAITKSQLDPSSLTYTRGVSVTNPQMPVAGGSFSILVTDVAGTIVDAAPQVDAVDLIASLIQEEGLWISAVAVQNTLSLVTLKFTFEAATVITVLSQAYTIEIIGPENFILSAKSTVRLSAGIPPAAIDPIVVKGNQVDVVTNANKAIPAGLHYVSFPVMNPTEVPTNNVWILNVYYGIGLAYTAALEGYRFGETTKVQ